jgi:EmrB/QacA subfamily drug resistance transporter
VTSTTTNRGTALALVAAAQFILQLDFSIVNVALPTIQRELHLVPADLQWIVTGYALTFGSLLLLGGRLGDLAGHRRLMMIGLVLFGVTSLSAGLAQTSFVLIASRFAQGASAAMVAPQAIATISDLFEEGAARARALGLFQAATAGGASAGIVLGGILTQYIGWRSIFLVNPPMIAILVVLMMRFLPRDGARRAARLDISGAVLVTTSIAALIFGLSQGQEKGFASPSSYIALIAAVALAISFVITEGRVAAPMVPYRILKDTTRRTALGVMFFLGAVLAGYVYFISLYLQRVLGFSPLLTGLSLVPSTGTVMVIASLITRRLLARFAMRRVLLAGLVSLGIGQFWFAHISASGSYIANVFGGLLFTAVGIGLLFPAVAVAVTQGVPAQDRGLAGGLLVTAQQIGAAVGLATLATIAAARTASAHDELVKGYQLAFELCVVLVVVALGVVLLGIRSRATPTPAPAPAPSPTASQ